jgi:hypothetical protein
MRLLVYTRHVTGQATPVGPDGSVLSMVATATEWTVLADESDTGFTNDARFPQGGEAAFTSDLTLTGATSYQEVGTITFGPGHCLHVATIGSGSLSPGPGLAVRHGAALWRVDGGDGQFAGVQGVITAQIVVDAALTMTGYHLGMLFVP